MRDLTQTSGVHNEPGRPIVVDGGMQGPIIQSQMNGVAQNGTIMSRNGPGQFHINPAPFASYTPFAPAAGGFVRGASMNTFSSHVPPPLPGAPLFRSNINTLSAVPKTPSPNLFPSLSARAPLPPPVSPMTAPPIGTPLPLHHIGHFMPLVQQPQRSGYGFTIRPNQPRQGNVVILRNPLPNGVPLPQGRQAQPMF
jgi:hypothetical protein